MRIQSLDWEDPLEEGIATHSNILAWRIPQTEESAGLQFIRLQGVRHNGTTLTSLRREPWECPLLWEFSRRLSKNLICI